MSVVRAVKLDEQMLSDIEKIASEKNSTVHAVMIEALKLYRDYHYAQTRASIINQEIINICKAIANNSEKTINYQTNKYLSELAIQNAITNKILANSLDIYSDEVDRYRVEAVENLKQNQRILKLEKMID